MTINAKIIKWNADKGFGFIRSESNPRDIFIHYTAFGRIPRRPMVGDVVVIDELSEADGKIKAVRARIQGVTPLANGNRGLSTYRRTRRKVGNIVLVIAVIAGIVVWLTGRIGNHDHSSVIPVLIPQASSEHFTCAGKRHCGEMTSKAEAQFYLKNCPHEAMDGDGNACEQQFGE